MFKSNNHTVGFLNSQYRNILKKCMIFNAFAIMSYIGNANAQISPDQWTSNPKELEITNAATMNGDYSEKNTLTNEHFIVLYNVLSIKGNGATATDPREPVIIANKEVKVSSSIVGEVFEGGFIYTQQSIDANSQANTISFGNSDINNNRVLGEYNSTTSNLEIKGGFITLGERDDRNQAPEYINHWGILVESNRNEFSNNEIVITDKSSSEDKTVRASGGLFYIMGSAKIDGGSLQGALISHNKVEVIDDLTIAGKAQQIATGGAIYNSGITYILNSQIKGNQAIAGYAKGGAIYSNTSSNHPSSFTIESTLLQKNNVTASIEGKGGAIYVTTDFEGAATETNYQNAKLTDVTFIENSINLNVSSPDIEYVAQGGAIYNNSKGPNVDYGSLSELTIMAKDQNIEYKANTINIIGATENMNIISQGGAIYNGNFGILTIQPNSKEISFKQNKAFEGGAIYNAANNTSIDYKDNSGETLTYTSAFNIDNSNGGIIVFNENEASLGGALFNANSAITNITNIGNISFSNNIATTNGGAVFNDEAASINIIAAADKTGVISFKNNTVSEGNGGAIYNKSSLDIEGNSLSFVENSSSNGNGGALFNNANIEISAIKNVDFKSNSAIYGGGIYNTSGGIVNINTTSDTIISFNSNTAEQGGAIYNEEGAEISFNLSESELIFETASDTIYNDGLLNITADNNGSIKLASNITGSGNFNLNTSNLEMINSIINPEQQLNFNGNNINLSVNSLLNLTPSDKLSSTTLTVSADSIIKYTGSLQTPDLTISGSLINSGILDLRDDVHSTVSFDSYSSDNGWYYFDVDTDAGKSDILKVNGSMTGSTNLFFKGMDGLRNKSGKILFAQTNPEQSIDDYNFIFDTRSDLFLVTISDEVSNGVRNWYIYNDGGVRTEVANYLILPRAAVEQTRGMMIDATRNNLTPRIRYEYGNRNKLRKVVDPKTKISLWANPVYRYATMGQALEFEGKIWGVDFGLNANITPSSKTGFIVSYRDGKYEKDGKEGTYYTLGENTFDMESTLLGLYYNKYFSNTYVNAIIYGGQQKARMNTDEDVFSSTSAIQAGFETEVGYQGYITNKLTASPSVKLSYDYIKYDDFSDTLGKKITVDAIHDVELEAAMKFEYRFNNEHQLHTVGYIKPSIVQLIEKGGEATVANTHFEDLIKNETSFKFEAGLEAALMQNFIVGGFGSYSFSSEYKALSVGGNIRYTW